jgi:hypothetical protein
MPKPRNDRRALFGSSTVLIQGLCFLAFQNPHTAALLGIKYNLYMTKEQT